MDTKIHPTAIVDAGAELGLGVQIGAFAIVEADVVIGDGTILHPRGVVLSGSKIGRDCEIHHGAVLGGPPQDVKFKGEKSFLVIGDRNRIREYATMHRATGEGCSTVVGDDNFFMAYAHVGHNARVGNRINFANCANLGGHVEIGDNAFVGGMTGFHQFVKVGEYAMIGGGSAVLEDVPPYMMTWNGGRAAVCALNTIGMTRAGFSPEARAEIKRAFKVIYRSNHTKDEAVRILEEKYSESPAVMKLARFLKESTRGISRPPAGSSKQECAS